MPVHFFHQTITVLATTAETGGTLGAVEVASPAGAAPPLHVHHREDEAFYVLDGDYTVIVGDERIAAAPGTWVWGPRDVPHGYQVHSPRGRHLSLTLPGGFEAFFDEVAHLATPTTDPRQVAADLSTVAARYGVDLLGPPGTQT